MGLENVVGVMSGVTLDMLLKYLHNTFPNMEVTQVQLIGDNKYQFAMQAHQEMSVLHRIYGGESHEGN